MISTHLYYKHVRNECIFIFQSFFFKWTFKTYPFVKIFKHDDRNNNKKEILLNNDFKSKILNIINYMGKWKTMFSIQMSLPDDKS